MLPLIDIKHISQLPSIGFIKLRLKVNVQAVVLYIKIYITMARDDLRLRLSGRTNFQIISDLFKASQALNMRIFTFFSKGIISVPRRIDRFY